LNEEKSIGACIRRVQARDPAQVSRWEIVVADNGSQDRSAEVASALGARVVSVPVPGYGSALIGGITAAPGQYVMFADADGTYFYEDALRLYDATLEGAADMGIASRMTGSDRAWGDACLAPASGNAGADGLDQPAVPWNV